MMDHRVITLPQAREARRLRELGWQIAAIRKAVMPHVCECTVRRCVSGIEYHRPRKVDPVAALRLKEAGWTFRRIGEQFGASPVAAFTAVRRAKKRIALGCSPDARIPYGQAARAQQREAA